ncbi:unnamed protein product [marine sediment metagenome]|uniref:Uncharacterized protein n=1 Tax=marine sediment metagenome TaxID=412755 RepID=X1QGA1_9ZZZZ
MHTGKRYVIPIVVAAVIFVLSLVPYWWGLPQTRAGIYYGSLFFAALLGASVLMLLLVAPLSTTDRGQRDYRVVHFALRLALTFGIGAVTVGVLLVAALLGLQLF